MPISFRELHHAFELADSADSLGGYQAILCRRTGKIYCHAEFGDLTEFNDELPDDVEDDEKYIALPDKRELDLGKPLVLDFAREFLRDDFDEVRYMFSKRGAYQKFKALLVRRHALDQWFAFEKKETEQALRRWCESNGIDVTD